MHAFFNSVLLKGNYNGGISNDYIRFYYSSTAIYKHIPMDGLSKAVNSV